MKIGRVLDLIGGFGLKANQIKLKSTAVSIQSISTYQYVSICSTSASSSFCSLFSLLEPHARNQGPEGPYTSMYIYIGRY